MKQFWPVLLILFGLGIILSGFCYDVIFAGIPFQDPTPDLMAQYMFHSLIAETIRGTGFIIFLIGLFAGLFRWVHNRFHT